MGYVGGGVRHEGGDEGEQEVGDGEEQGVGDGVEEEVGDGVEEEVDVGEGVEGWVGISEWDLTVRTYGRSGTSSNLSQDVNEPY